ncbi:hypothetical protein CapIbe_008158 [Capra ibex]
MLRKSPHVVSSSKGCYGIMVNNHGLLHAVLLSSLRTSYENLSLNHVAPGYHRALVEYHVSYIKFLLAKYEHH